MNLIPFVYIWIVLATVVLALALYRLAVASHEDESLHVLESEAPLVAEQTKVYKKIETIDWWGQALTVIAVLYGLVLAGIYLYHVWQQSSKIQMG